QGMIRIEADLCREIKRYRQSSVTVAQQIFVTFVGFFSVAHTRVLAHGPESPAIHGRLHATCVREITGVAVLLVIIPALQTGRRKCHKNKARYLQPELSNNAREVTKCRTRAG